MATIKTDLICNLNQPVNVTYLHGNLFSQDNAGNTINVFVMDNGEPATIGGTVSANVIRSDGQTVAVSGAIEGNKAYVILPQACYAVPGVVHIIIKLTQNTTITTIAAIVANVYMSTTDAVIDPGTVIPSIQALMALIEEAVDSIPTDYTGLLHTIAADYSSSKTYKVGDYAWESGVLKRCIVPITAAETYTAAHWTNAVIGDDLTNLKSAIGVEGIYNSPITTSGSGKEVGKFYPTYGKKYLVSFFGLVANRVYLYEYDTNGSYTTFSNEVTAGKSEYEIEYSPTVSNVSYLRLYVGSPSGSQKGGNCIVYNLSNNGDAKRIKDLQDRTKVEEEKTAGLEDVTGFLNEYHANVTTSGAGVEIGKFYPENGNNYLFSLFNLVAYRLYLYEFDTNGNYTTYADIVAAGKSEIKIEYSPTEANIDYVRIYAASPSGSEKGGDCFVYQINGNNQANEIYTLEQGMNIVDKNSMMFIVLEDGGIDNTGAKTSTENMVRFADKIKIAQEEYKVSITSEKAVGACYCATFDTDGELIERIVVPSTDAFSDFATGEYGFFITPGSSVVYIQPYFAGGTETISTANVSRPTINKPTKKDIKILACGDSICRGARNNFSGFVGGNGFRFKNIGVGNSSLATNSGTGVENIPNTFAAETSYTPDVIISDGGINDYHYDSPLGVVPAYPVTTDEEASALDRSTVMGGAAYLFYQMVKKFPDARRYFVITHKTLWNTGATPTYCPTENNEQGYTQKDLHDALVALCNVYGVVVIDVYNNSIIDTKFGQYRSPVAWASDASTANQYMVDADGVHPTAKGYIYGYAPFVKAALANDLK